MAMILDDDNTGRRQTRVIEVDGRRIPVSTPITQTRTTTYPELKNRITHEIAKTIKAPIPAKEKAERVKTLVQQRQQVEQYHRRGYKLQETNQGYMFSKSPEDIYREQVELKKLVIKRSMKGTPSERLEGLGYWVTTGFISDEDPLGVFSTYHALTGNIEKAIEFKAKAGVDLDTALSQGMQSYVMKVATGPMAKIGTSFALGAGMGAGVGALKATYPTIGKIVEAGIVGSGAYLTGKEIYSAYKSGDQERQMKILTTLGLTLPATISGYRHGYHYGYGKSEAYLYKIHTYQRGSSEYIRFEQAIKLSRLLEDVKTKKIKPIDFAKDIMRMNKQSAKQVMNYLRAHPKTTIGGSSASYAQIFKARQPRDIDLFVKGGSKDVSSAKNYFKGLLKTKKGEHVIDIHGKEMFKPGQYHRFGFVSKQPIKIGKYQYQRSGELLFRKGVSASQKDYYHSVIRSKDVPDFVTHAKSQIQSLRLSKIPFSKYRAGKAEEALNIFIQPIKAKSYGTYKTNILSNIFKSHTKPVPTKLSLTPIGYEYLYPKSSYPSYLTGGLLAGGYTTNYLRQYYSKQITPAKYYINKSLVNSFSNLIKQQKKTPSITGITKKGSYPKTSYSFKLPSIVGGTPSKKTTSGYPSVKYKPRIQKIEDPSELMKNIIRKNLLKPVDLTTGYREREFKVTKIEDLLGNYTKDLMNIKI